MFAEYQKLSTFLVFFLLKLMIEVAIIIKIRIIGLGEHQLTVKYQMILVRNSISQKNHSASKSCTKRKKYITQTDENRCFLETGSLLA